MPLSVQWISGLSRGVSTRAALRVFVVSLCVLITLLMAILNFVSCTSASQLLCHIYLGGAVFQPVLSSPSSSSQETTAQRLPTGQSWRVSNSTLCL